MRRLAVLLALAMFSNIPVHAQNSGSNAAQVWQFDRLYGKVFPAMELELPDSTTFTTTGLAGKTVYVDFWFTTCAPCIKEIPYAKKLQQYFAHDTNIVFLNICIDNMEKKDAWRQMVSTKKMPGIHVFYARNRPQIINLPRQLSVDNYPAFMLVHNSRVVGYNAPAPSHKGFVQWAIYQASKGVPLSVAYTAMRKRTPESTAYLRANWPAIEADTDLP